MRHGVEVLLDVVVGRVGEEHLVEEGAGAVAAHATVLGVVVADEGVGGDLTHVTALEEEDAKGLVERVEKAGPVLGSEELRPGLCIRANLLRHWKRRRRRIGVTDTLCGIR